MAPKKPKIPLRERKKEIIRKSLIEAAMKLFGERGYENVTLEEVAEEAVVHVQTLYKYFKTKENLAPAIVIDKHEQTKEILEDPNRTEDTLSAWRKYRLEDSSLFNDKSVKSQYVQLGVMTASVPNLKAQNLAYSKRTETILTIHLAKDAGKDPEKDIHSRLLASMLVSSYLVPERKLLIFPISASGSNFNPRNTSMYSCG